MKTIGINKMVTLTEEKAKYWITHQSNQRAPIPQHVKALAKLLARVGWRNDQRICITDDDRIINGLQRLSAIVQLGDYGWKIPVTVFSSAEMTNDMLESFNVQKGDSPARLMRRLYGWTDKRRTQICSNIWRCLEIKQNTVASDLLAVYEGFRDQIDDILSVKEPHKTGVSSIPYQVYVAAVFCAADGLDISPFKNIAEDFVNDNKSHPFWRALKDWDMLITKDRSGGRDKEARAGSTSTNIIYRYILMNDLLQDRKIRSIKSVAENPELIHKSAAHCRSLIRAKIGII